MINFYDIAYGAGLLASGPVWLTRRPARHKVLSALRDRMGASNDPVRTGLVVMIHAVSVGEMNATRALVSRLRSARPGVGFLVTTTTQTGYERAQQLYGDQPDVRVMRYPLDFTLAINRLLNRERPSVVVLLELELWPNFLDRCRQRGIPVALINGRMTAGSFRNLSRFKWLARRMLGALQKICVQDADYARQFIALGADESRVKVTGTMKFDTAQIGSHIEGDHDLAADVGLRPGERVWVAGSTGPGEETLLLDVYDRLSGAHPDLRLVMVPRKPERFDEVAQLILSRGFGLSRRSQPGDARTGNKPVVVLGDTMGELRKFYSVASIVFVGRTLVDMGHRQHGSDMIEPAALAKPVIVGPFTTNFADVMRWLRASSAIREVATADQLVKQMQQLLDGPEQAQAMGRRAQQVVIDQQGATDRHVDAILELLNAR